MKMKLIIVRHGEADASVSELDAQRQLTDRGRGDIARMGKLAKETGWKFKDIRHSPLLRTLQTAGILTKEFDSDKAMLKEEPLLAPGIDLGQAESLLAGYDSSDASIWVFHAPDVARLSVHLTGMPENGFYFPPGTMVAINVVTPNPVGRSMLIWKMQPEFLGFLK